MSDQPRLICVSNRLPITAQVEADKIVYHPSSGGLVTAIGPVLRSARGAWIGWPGTISQPDCLVRKSLAEFSVQSDFEMIPVILDQESVSGFYQGFSNQIIWPLFHDLQSRCNFDPIFWSSYLKVQQLFTDEICNNITQADLLWIHDYHLMGLGRELRKRQIKNKICFFLHTPFPAPDIFLKLPWREDVIQSLLSYDLVGFQTKRDRDNFHDCVSTLTEIKCINRGDLILAKSPQVECLFGTFPISIDFDEFEEIARLAHVEANVRKIREDMGVEYLILSIDRLDYTKGIPYRIKAFRRLLEMEANLKKRIALLQVVVPSRVEVPEYKQLSLEIEQLVSQVNGALGEPGWVPVHHLFRSLNREDLISMYRASDVAMITPLKDGMNLVAKEYCASRLRNGGAIVLSEFAGVADEFKDLAFLVNPYDIDGVARALSLALATTKVDTRDRMSKMREIVRNADVYKWAKLFLEAAGWHWDSHQPEPRAATIWEKLLKITKVFDI